VSSGPAFPRSLLVGEDIVRRVIWASIPSFPFGKFGRDLQRSTREPSDTVSEASDWLDIW